MGPVRISRLIPWHSRQASEGRASLRCAGKCMQSRGQHADRDVPAQPAPPCLHSLVVAAATAAFCRSRGRSVHVGKAKSALSGGGRSTWARQPRGGALDGAATAAVAVSAAGVVAPGGHGGSITEGMMQRCPQGQAKGAELTMVSQSQASAISRQRRRAVAGGRLASSNKPSTDGRQTMASVRAEPQPGSNMN